MQPQENPARVLLEKSSLLKLTIGTKLPTARLHVGEITLPWISIDQQLTYLQNQLTNKDIMWIKVMHMNMIEISFNAIYISKSLAYYRGIYCTILKLPPLPRKAI